MTGLNEEQKQLLFDYCVGLTTEGQAAKAEKLISSNKEASEIYSKLKAVLSPLEDAEVEFCPDDLVERTILRLTNTARSSQLRLQQLLAEEHTRTITARSWSWHNLVEVLAVAAVIVFVAGVLVLPLNFARKKSWEQQCQMQLSRVFQGISNYSADHDGQMPEVATQSGAPWWKVGYQGSENQSNTRHIWLLVKEGYVSPADFVCPGKREGQVLQFDALEAKRFNDFPARRYITYSFRLECDKNKGTSAGRSVLMADLNPLFERLPQNYSQKLRLQLNENLSALNSANHSYCGQNILFSDGSVKFKKVRRVGISQDDIFTLKGIKIYEGCEMPSCETDAFLAP